MDHLYIVTYDIASQKRWRAVFGILQGYGEWLQLSVFQCRLSRIRQLQLAAALTEAINAAEDHILILDLGVVTETKPKVMSYGKPFSVVERGTIIA